MGSGWTKHDTIEDRFWSKVERSDDCWTWTGAKTRRNNGYGRFRFNGDLYVAHRVAYELLRGPIADGLVIDHLCRNTLCVNPDHMEIVTQTENIRRGEAPSAINGRKTHCIRGHELTGDNVWIHQHTGYRLCKVCRKMRDKNYV